MHPKLLKRLKALGILVVIILLVYWLSISIASELIRHKERTLDFLAGIDSIKHWFFLMRLCIYLGFYALWPWIITKLKPEIYPETIAETRKFLVRFFIVYELFFGVNIIAFVMR